MDKDSTAHPGSVVRIEDGVTWYSVAGCGRAAIRLPSHHTNGEYAVVELVADSGSSVPLNIQQNEERHIVVLEGAFRLACGDRTFDAATGTSLTVPKGVPLAWRNISNRSGRLLCTFTPAGGFEQFVQEFADTPADKAAELAARHGCTIVGPPI